LSKKKKITKKKFEQVQDSKEKSKRVASHPRAISHHAVVPNTFVEILFRNHKLRKFLTFTKKSKTDKKFEKVTFREQSVQLKLRY